MHLSFLKYICLSIGLFLSQLLMGQTCDSPALLCFGQSTTNITNSGLVAGPDAPCFDADNSLFLSFFTNDIGGDATVSISIDQCVDSVQYDLELTAAIIDATNLCDGNTYTYLTCNGADASFIQMTAFGLLPNTTYYVQVDGDLSGPGITNAAECQFDVSISGNGVELPIGASPDEAIVVGESVQIFAEGGDSYIWSPPTGLSDPNIADPIASPAESTEYEVTIINGECEVTRRVNVFVFAPIAIFDAITPNGDGYNDEWYLQRIDNYPQAVVKIFNRWGQIVFKSIGYNTPWDGTNNGNKLPAGNYYYVIELNEPEIKENLFTGSVTIIY